MNYENLIAVSKGDDVQNGSTTIWFAPDEYEDAHYGVVFSGTDDPVLVDCDGAPASRYEADIAANILEALKEKAIQAMTDL